MATPAGEARSAGAAWASVDEDRVSLSTAPGNHACRAELADQID